MSTRRTILRGIIGSFAASVYALAEGPTTSTAAAAQQGGSSVVRGESFWNT